MDTNKISLFQEQPIRKTYHENEWWFSVTDVVAALTDSANARDYWFKMKIRVKDEGGNELSTNCRQLKLAAHDNKMRETDCANTEGIFRIIQSIPSPKAEPFKLWLAKVGYERVQEIENPELATQRSRQLYKAKGYPEGWIEKRMRGIVIREELTDEWKDRGARGPSDYAILTAEISRATFGLTPKEYRQVKGLARENLRDHMTDLELIFSMLGERATAEIHRVDDSQGIPKLQTDARIGGSIAGGARKHLESRLKKSVIHQGNFLPKSQSKGLPPPKP